MEALMNFLTSHDGIPWLVSAFIVMGGSGFSIYLGYADRFESNPIGSIMVFAVLFVLAGTAGMFLPGFPAGIVLVPLVLFVCSFVCYVVSRKVGSAMNDLFSGLKNMWPRG